jgi:large subunit ribosomal protein L15
LEERFKKKDEVTPAALAAAGLIRDAEKPVKILGRGELKKALTVHAHRFTGSAKEKIESAGGSLQTLELEVTGARATVKKLRKEQLVALREARSNAESK